MPCGGSNLRDVDMEIADRIGLELPLGRGLAFDLGQPRDSAALQAAVQRRARQMRDGRLKRVQAVVQRQQRMPAEGDDHRFFLDAERTVEGSVFRAGRKVGDRPRFFHFATVFGLIPYRWACALRLA